MNATNPLAEAKATLAIGDPKRRERLLKTIRGKPEWVFYASLGTWMILIERLFIHPSKYINNPWGFVLFPLLITAVAVHQRYLVLLGIVK